MREQRQGEKYRKKGNRFYGHSSHVELPQKNKDGAIGKINRADPVKDRPGQALNIKSGRKRPRKQKDHSTGQKMALASIYSF